MPFESKNQVLIDKLEATLKVRRSTARVYASTLATLSRSVKIPPEDVDSLTWLTKKKVLTYVGDVNNLTKRKNLASGIVAGLKVIGEKKVIDEYRQILMKADKDYTSFLASGKRKRPYRNADAAWTKIKSLWKKVSSIVSTQKLWQRGEHVDQPEYRTLMALAYLKFLSDMPVRRLEYVSTRFWESKDDPPEGGNYIIVKKRGPWVWSISDYKTFRTFGKQESPITTGLRTILTKIRPITKAKNNDEYIFLNSRWRQMSRDLFSKFVGRVFQTYMGKQWTQNTIRSIKISSVWKDSIKTIDALRISEEMAHDPRTAMLHYR